MEDKEPAFNSQAVVEDEDCGDEEYPGTLVALMILVIVIIVSVIAIQMVYINYARQEIEKKKIALTSNKDFDSICHNINP